MNTNIVAKQYRLKQWAQMISQCRSSGMRILDWCEQNNITKANYYYRLRQVREAMLISGEPTQIVAVPEKVYTLAANTTNNNSTDGGISITIGDSIIRVEPGTSSELLTMVLGVMKHAE